MALTPLSAADDGPPLQILEPICAVFRRTLKGEGLKYTPERAQILETVLRFDGLFDADTLQNELKSAGFRVSKATVYRTIKLLQDAGIIQSVLFDQEQAHYQVVYGSTPHDLLVRVDTGEIIRIDIPELIALRDAVCKAKGLTPAGHRLQIFATAR